LDLWGNLKDFSLPDVIQLVGFGRKTGVLSVEYDTGSSMLFFQDGHVVHAKNGSLEGEEAVYELFHVLEGEFKFQADKEAPRQTIHMDPTNLVMEAARLLDESSRLAMEQEEEEQAQKEAAAAAVAAAVIPEASPAPKKEAKPKAKPTAPKETEKKAQPKAEPQQPQKAADKVEPSQDEGEYIRAEDLLPDGGLFDEEFEGASTEAQTPGISADEVRKQIKALLDERFNRDAKRLMQAVDKCGDTFEDFEQLSVRVVRFVSAFVDPASANALGEEIRQIIGQLDISS
jgi:hypothetical protein